MRKWIAAALLIAVLLGGLAPLPKSQADIFREREIWNTAVTTGTDILSVSLTPTKRGSTTVTTTACTYRCTVGIDPAGTASVLYVRITSGAASKNFAINSGVALQPGQLFGFELSATATFTYNFRVATNTTIGILSVDRPEGQ